MLLFYIFGVSAIGGMIWSARQTVKQDRVTQTRTAAVVNWLEIIGVDVVEHEANYDEEEPAVVRPRAVTQVPAAPSSPAVSSPSFVAASGPATAATEGFRVDIRGAQ